MVHSSKSSFQTLFSIDNNEVSVIWEKSLIFFSVNGDSMIQKWRKFSFIDVLLVKLRLKKSAQFLFHIS